MSTDSQAPESTDDVDDDKSPFSYHYEPPAQGGARYVRCEECGAECVPADPDRMVHRPGCSQGDIQ